MHSSKIPYNTNGHKQSTIRMDINNQEEASTITLIENQDNYS